MFKDFRDGKFAIGLTLGVTITLALGIWIFSLNYCPNAPCHYQIPPNESETYNQRWFPIPWAPNSTLRPQPKFDDRIPTKYEYNDLRAQENMARATNVIAWATIVTVITSIVGVWLLVSNLKSTGETNAIMRHEQRPWLTFEVMGETEMKFFRGGAEVHIGYQIKNHGKTPAFFASMVTKVIPYDHPAQIKDMVDEFSTSKPWEEPSGEYAIIFPDETIKIPPKDRQTYFFKGQPGLGYALVTVIIYRTTSDPKSAHGIEIRAYTIGRFGPDATSQHEVILFENVGYRISI